MLENHWRAKAITLTFASLLLCVMLSARIEEVSALDNGLAIVPPMGWNSWNHFGKGGFDETTIYETIDAMVTSGMRDAGYTYVVLDGGWRDNHLGLDGELLPHPKRFPNGIKPIADYAHAKGLKLGLHTCPGETDCGRDPVGGLGREILHVSQFVEWGVDFVKLDNCYLDGSLMEEKYKLWRDWRAPHK